MRDAKLLKSPKPQRAAQTADLIGPNNLPLAYYNMPKSACTTIKNILYYIQHGEWNKDPLAIHKQIRFENVILRAGEFRKHVEQAAYDRPYTVFSFVRHPELRVYSTFVEKVWASGPYCFPVVREAMGKLHGYRLRALETGQFDQEEVRTGFKQFLHFVVQNLAGETKMPPNPHWAVQFKRLRKTSANDFVSFIGRVENFEHDMSFVLRRAGWDDVSITSCRFNEGPKPPFKLQDLLDDEMAEMLAAIYQDDFKAFDYKPLR